MASPKRAVILAAGFGMRMVPINTETPKAFIEIDGESLIERIIKQLHAVGVNDITIVVGFMKERFDYLIDEYDVKLAVNRDYASKNNLILCHLSRDLWITHISSHVISGATRIRLIETNSIPGIW